MLFLEALDPKKDIQLYINSPGGSVSAGFAIFDTMQYIKCDVSTICIGRAASFGAFLLVGGMKGKCMALPNAEIMIHHPVIHCNGIQGQATDIKITSDHIQKNKENTGKSVEEIVLATERVNYMDAKETMNFGLIDIMIDRH